MAFRSSRGQKKDLALGSGTKHYTIPAPVSSNAQQLLVKDVALNLFRRKDLLMELDFHSPSCRHPLLRVLGVPGLFSTEVIIDPLHIAKLLSEVLLRQPSSG